MLPLDDLILKIEGFIRDKRPFKPQAYLFVLSALEYTMTQLGRKEKSAIADRHVSGQELSHGIKDYAKTQFGPTAKMVLEHWGITATSDFGRIVYDLIEMGYLGKNDRDRIEDFDKVFDLDYELIDNYHFTMEK
jgi:uncharacterized repeat protein (TIGR04138 family)